MSTSHNEAVRELDHRSGNGLDVVLVWYAETNTIAIHVFDAATLTAHRAEVDPGQAADAFLHPFAYLPGRVLVEAKDELRAAQPERPATLC